MLLFRIAKYPESQEKHNVLCAMKQSIFLFLCEYISLIQVVYFKNGLRMDIELSNTPQNTVCVHSSGTRSLDIWTIGSSEYPTYNCIQSAITGMPISWDNISKHKLACRFKGQDLKTFQSARLDSSHYDRIPCNNQGSSDHNPFSFSVTSASIFPLPSQSRCCGVWNILHDKKGLPGFRLRYLFPGSNISVYQGGQSIGYLGNITVSRCLSIGF